MRARLSFAAGAAWAGATAAATLISWAGVQIVTSAVTPSPVAVLPASQIASDSKQGTPHSVPATVTAPAGAAAAPPATSSTVPTSPTSVVASTPPAEPTGTIPAPPTATPSTGGVTATTAAVTQPTTATRPTTVTTPPSTRQPTTTSTIPTSTTTPTTTSTTTMLPQAQEYSTPGGNATFSCSGQSISLVSASPANGYQLWVPSSGPRRAQVDFQSQRDQEWITAACQNGQPQAQTSSGTSGGTYDQPTDGAPGYS